MSVPALAIKKVRKNSKKNPQIRFARMEKKLRQNWLTSEQPKIVLWRQSQWEGHAVAASTVLRHD